MSDDKPVTTPATPATTTGSATETHGMNNNLDPSLQGGPAAASDVAKTDEVTEQNAEQGVPVQPEP